MGWKLRVWCYGMNIKDLMLCDEYYGFDIMWWILRVWC